MATNGDTTKSPTESLPTLGDVFDPNAELLIHHHLRPLWSQAGAVVFITFRTADSIPAEVVTRWGCEKQDWLQRRGLANVQPS